MITTENEYLQVVSISNIIKNPLQILMKGILICHGFRFLIIGLFCFYPLFLLLLSNRVALGWANCD
jgi:hypothetical protein